jgi:hypothetical protein
MPEPVLITDSDRTAFAAAIRAHGWREADFELELETLDPNTAEVEACLGKAGVRCLPTEAVEVYRLGDGSDWLADFAADLGRGRFGEPRQG